MSGRSDSIQHAEAQQGKSGAAAVAPSRHRMWVAALFGAGLLVRLYFAGFLYLDPDEVLHYWVSVQPTLRAAYHATLATAHPPLFIILLYYWRVLGHSEIVLRLPGVLAGLAFGWVIYRWIARVADQFTAEIALPLLLFTPSLIWLSAEVRQYWLLLLFVALALYCFERAMAEQSIGWMITFTLALDLALASHYSALLFALTMGIYALVRLNAVRVDRKLLLTCALGQFSALAEVGIFFKTHISLLKKAGLPQEIADTWLHQSIYHTGDHAVSFLLRNTLRFFRYFFGNGIVGALALAAFVLGIYIVCRNPGAPADVDEATRQRSGNRARERKLALFILLPFVIAAWTALEGLYPYGGTRHDVFLAPFVILGISMALSFGKRTRPLVRSAAIVVVLALANIFASPAGPFIKPQNQSKSLMASAAAELRNSPPGSLVFTDYQGGLVLSYYLCDHPAIELAPPYQPFTRTSCGVLNVVSEAPSGGAIAQQWTFRASDLAQNIRELETLYSLRSGNEILVFRAGWSVSADPELIEAFRNLGCNPPRYFGRNILVCAIKTH